MARIRGLVPATEHMLYNMDQHSLGTEAGEMEGKVYTRGGEKDPVTSHTCTQTHQLKCGVDIHQYYGDYTGKDGMELP